MTAISQSVRNAGYSNPITLAAMWLADHQVVPSQKKPTLPEIASRFGLTDGDAAEAILLAGNYSLCRRAF